MVTLWPVSHSGCFYLFLSLPPYFYIPISSQLVIGRRRPSIFLDVPSVSSHRDAFPDHCCTLLALGDPVNHVVCPLIVQSTLRHLLVIVYCCSNKRWLPGYIINCSVFHFPSWSCQLATVACTHKPRYLNHLPLCWFFWKSRKST